MLEIARLRNDREAVAEGLAKRGLDMTDVDRALALDDRRKAEQLEMDQLQAEANALSKQIGALMKSGDRAGGEAMKGKVADTKAKLGPLQDAHAKTKEELESVLLKIPNVPHASVPYGKSAEDNEVYKAGPDELPVLPKGAKPHWELGEQYRLFDMQLGVKLTGAGFPVYIGQGARLQRALIAYFLDRATDAGYLEYLPPHLVNADSARGTGALPDKEGQMYHATVDDLYLIPTAEVPVTNVYRGSIVDEAELPIKMCAYTPCFRREAGSYGKEVRGLNRVHQFDKVEIVRIERPEDSYAALDDMLTHVSGLLEELGLPYRILKLCGGDATFTSALTYDFEVWSAAQQLWLEVSSVSNFETFQSNRLNLRLRDGKQKRLAHTLNGSALALARIVAAILENNQTEKGITVPKVLVPYMNGREVID